MKEHFSKHRAIALGLSLFAASSATAASPIYTLINTIHVGGAGGWDYATVDTAARRLYVSHSTKVVVIDLDENKVVGEITNTPGVHGIAIAPRLGRAFTSNGRENKVSIVDLKSLQTISKVETGENPDAILFEPRHEEVYAFNGRSKDATVIDAKTGQVVATIPLGGKPEFAQTDTEANRVFVNVEDKSEVVAIDAARHEVVARWPIAPGEEASGMAIDLTHHRLFLGCGNQLMLMLDYTTGKLLGSVAIGDGVDANAFDPTNQLAFASCGDGTTTIAREESPDKLTVVQTINTAFGSRTMTLDPMTHRIYLATAEFEPATASQHRPKAVDGSFKVLVFDLADAASSLPDQ